MPKRPTTPNTGVSDTRVFRFSDSKDEREIERLREVADAARDFMDDPGETNEKIDRLNDALDALERPE